MQHSHTSDGDVASVVAVAPSRRASIAGLCNSKHSLLMTRITSFLPIRAGLPLSSNNNAMSVANKKRGKLIGGV